jgi:hypothetical protein
MSRSGRYLVALMVALGPSASSPTLAMAQTVGKAGFEAEPVFSARDLVPAPLLKGPGFVLDPKTGKFSPRASEAMGAAGWKIREGMDAAQK